MLEEKVTEDDNVDELFYILSNEAFPQGTQINMTETCHC